MKIFLIACASLLLSMNCWGNAIDAIRSDADAISFIHHYFPEYDHSEINFETFPNNELSAHAGDSIKFLHWAICDLDSNGENDLLLFNVRGFPDVVGLFSKNGNYEKVESAVKMKKDGPYGARVKNLNGLNLILLFHEQPPSYDLETRIVTPSHYAYDTLIYKFGLFINYVANPHAYFLEKFELKFNYSQCEENSRSGIRISIDPD